MRQLPSKAISARSDFSVSTYFVQLPEHFTLGDVLSPHCWVHQRMLRPNDLIRVRAFDGSFDLHIVVDHVEQAGGGAVVSIWPKYPKDTEAYEISPDAAAAREAAAAVKPAISGKFGGKPVPRVEHNGVNLHHVIGLNGDVVSKHHKTKGAAQREMRAYLERLRMEVPADIETEAV